MLVRKKGLAPITVLHSEDKQKRSMNTYSEMAEDFYEGGVSIDGAELDTEMTDKEIIEMLANIEDNREILSNFLLYNYISNGDVYQQFTAFKSLPKLEYKIGAFDNNVTQYQESINLINKVLFKVRYKEVLRDIISQSCLDGGVVCIWCGNGESVFPYIFESTEYVYPKYRRNGDWVCVLDLALLSEFKEDERLALFENLSPIVTEAMYNAYQNNTSDESKRYIELPQERTSYIRNGNQLTHGQRMSIPLGTQSLQSINHKKRLQNLEDVIASKASRNIAILKIGINENGKSFIDIPLQVRRNVTNGVGKALKQSSNTSSNKIPLATLPEFCDLKLAEVDGLEGLGSDKFGQVESDLVNSSGLSNGLTKGTGSNNAGNLINLEYVYRRIAVILEQLDGFLNKIIPLAISGTDADSLFIELDKDQPLDKKTRLETLFKLQSEGLSVKHVTDELGINYNDYIEQSIRENVDMKLKDLIMPFLSSYTLSSKEQGQDTNSEENSEGGDEGNEQ